MEKPIPQVLRDFDPAEMRILDEIRDKCRALHVMPPPVIRVGLEVFDKDGNLVSSYRDLSRSWVRNAYNLAAMQTLPMGSNQLGTTYGDGTPMMSLTNGGTPSSYSSPTNHRLISSYVAAAGVGTSGIVIGTGAGAESFNDYALGAIIPNGSAAGQMDYAAMVQPTPTWNAGTRKFAVVYERFINNNSGATITVNEVGLYPLLFYALYNQTSTAAFMLARDLVSPGVAVANTAQLKVTYTIESAVYPA